MTVNVNGAGKIHIIIWHTSTSNMLIWEKGKMKDQIYIDNILYCPRFIHLRDKKNYHNKYQWLFISSVFLMSQRATIYVQVSQTYLIEMHGRSYPG